MNEPTTDWGDDWVEPDINKRFGIVKKKSSAWIVLLIVLACLVYIVFRSLT